ncbi:MAG: zinc metallopeptidase [Phycisphaerae bacterium]
MFGFDPLYFLLLAPALLLGLWAQFRVKSAFARGSEIPASGGMTGAEAARRILLANGLQRVQIEPAHGYLGDHYDPRAKVLRLSPEVYHGRSVASVGVAAHEAGHAIQDAAHYGPLKLRNGIVPLASTGSQLAWILFFIGLVFSTRYFGQVMMLLGIGLFSTVVLFQLVNLPVEFDASRRARQVLVANGIVSGHEDAEVGRVLNAAALTYVAATLTAIMTLVYLLIRSGLLGGGRRE